MCGSVGGGGTSRIGMGYHLNILLKTDAGEAETEMESLIQWKGGRGRRATDRISNLVDSAEFALRR